MYRARKRIRFSFCLGAMIAAAILVRHAIDAGRALPLISALRLARASGISRRQPRKKFD